MAVTCVGVVLAGGRSTRFGAEKAVAQIDGAPILARVVAVLAAGAAEVAVNARSRSGAAMLARRWGLVRLDDPPDTAAGPLAGVLAGLNWARARDAAWLATAPCDTPHLPGDLVQRLTAAAHDACDAVVATTAERDHPLCALWRVSAQAVVADALAGGAHPPVRRVLEALDALKLEFDDPCAFANVNTPADLVAAGR